MPYYLYKISTLKGIDLVKKLELLDQFESFRDAKKAKQLRAELESEDYSYKVMFAENQLSAEEQLLEKRDQPVLMEHER
jgi:ribosomal protein L14E/L6E/L27E